MQGFLTDSDYLAHDKGEGDKNQERYERSHRSFETASYNQDGTPIREIFVNMLRNNSMQANYFKEQIAPLGEWREEFSQAWAELVCEIDIDDEDSFSPLILDRGHQIEIRLI